MNAIRLLPRLTFLAVLFAFASCQTTATTSHQFAEPSGGWQTKSGQISYTDKTTTLIGEVLVRHGKGGAFELTFTKAGGITLLSLRQDATHGKIEGPLARRPWAGPLAEKPARHRGWFELRDKIVNGRRGTTIRHDSGEQTFTLRF